MRGPSTAEQVREQAAAAATFSGAAERASGCTACPELAATRTHVVFGEPAARGSGRLAVLGEAPGAQEDASGLPFVGKAGQVLDRLLGEAGVAREDVAVFNVLRCRPPGNRRPRPAEVAACSGWLERSLALLDPAVVLVLGLSAAAVVLDGAKGLRLADVRGSVRPGLGRQVVISYHPSGALRWGPDGAPMAALRADVALAVAAAMG